MQVTVKLFAQMREVVGSATLTRQLAQGATVGDLMAELGAEFPGWQEAASHTVIAVNREFANEQRGLAVGDEVAFFPPVSGGSGEEGANFAITLEPLSIDEVVARVLRPETGAVAVFEGVVRNISGGKAVEHLEYEAYREMAEAKLRQVAQEARRQWPDIVDVAIVQRIGHLEVGQAAVVVAVSSVHRDDGCFEACRFAIDRLKQIVPIWKKEVGPDGTEWIEGDYLASEQDASQ